MKKIELEIVALSHSVTQSHSYAVVLGDLKGTKRLPIVIGGFEAQSIAVAIEKMAPTRPLTHDLMKNMCETFGIDLKEVIINDLSDGIFYSKLICKHNGETVEIDSRTSDALALAVRFECPIYTYDFILESAGISLEESEIEGETEKIEIKSAPSTVPSDLNEQTIDELADMLQNALDNEDYERAATIRDEINKKKKSS